MKYDKMTNTALFDFSKTIAESIFYLCEYPYEIIDEIKSFIIALQNTLDKDKYDFHGDIVIAKDADVSDKAEITGPVIIDSHAEIRPFAYIRGSAIIGKHAVVGNSSEIKNSILFNHSKVPHYNYVGDSILGYMSHLGAGTKISNFKINNSDINIKYKNNTVKTNLRKFGAAIGDYAEIGCNSVLNPGTVIGKNTIVYPMQNVRGFVESDKIYKNEYTIIDKK